MMMMSSVQNLSWWKAKKRTKKKTTHPRGSLKISKVLKTPRREDSSYNVAWNLGNLFRFSFQLSRKPPCNMRD